MHFVLSAGRLAVFMFVLVIASLFARAQSTETILFGFTNAWRYNQTTSYDGVNWTGPGFNDAALPLGRGVLGNESNNSFVTSRTNTVLALGRMTYYFRTTFVFDRDISGAILTFSNILDDGAVFHLNGREVHRLSMPAAPTVISYNTAASSHEATGFDVFSLSGPILETNLVHGTNVLAVEVHQQALSSSDIVFGLALSTRPTPRTPAPLKLPLDPPTFGYTMVNAFPGLSFGGPLCLVTPPGETNRLFVLDKAGRMLVITNLANPTLTTVLNLSGRVFTGSESGLLGLAFHPGFATNRYFYLFYSQNLTSSQGSGLHQRISRFQITETNANVVLTNSELVLISQRDPAGNHNGGDLHFGPDGYLYITLGDGGVQYDGDRNSQIITANFFSAILRIDVDQRPGNLPPNIHPASFSTNYAIPADNPFIGRTSFDGLAINPANIRTEFYAIGFRNPWRMTFDPVTQFLYCADVGQDTWEEVSVITKGGNYGWAYREGLHNGYRDGTPVEPLIDPIQEYRHGSGPDQGNSVTGGVVYRGNRIPELHGWYIFSDFTSGNVWALHYDGTNTIPFRRLTGQTGLAGFGGDPRNGDVLAANVQNGTIYRLIQDTNTLVGAPLPPTLADTGAFADLTTLTNQTQPLSANEGLQAYDINAPFWSDHARKSRWFLSHTNLKMGFHPEGNWSFPSGMAWVKHFDLELTNGVPESSRRLETRFLVKNDDGVYGITYRWNSLTNAVLVPDGGLDEALVINEGGILRTQVWHYPSRAECLACHTPTGGWALGFNTAQLNQDFGFADGVSNQIAFMAGAGLFSNAVTELNSLRALAPATDASSSREWRVRSYLAANCAQCHQPGGTGFATWNAGIANSTADSGLINGAVNNNFGNPDARVIAPGSLTNSMLLQRISTRGPGQMPPLATSELDHDAIGLISAWITNDLAAGWSNAIDPFQISLRATNGIPVLEFIHPANRAFRVEAATNLAAPITWHFLDVPENRPSYPAVSNQVTMGVSGTNGDQRFYRVRMTTP